jgi:hypothetical protein
MIRVKAPINLDINSGNSMGIGMGPNFAAGRYRTTSASANLKERPDNLLIWTDTTVGKIIFQGVDAIGVATLDGRKGNINLYPFQTNPC